MTIRTEKRTTAACSASANALNRAIEYLTAALCEIDQAHACASARGTDAVGAADEKVIYDALSRLLTEAPGAGKGMVDRILALRDRRAARAGFSFDE